MIIDPRSNVPVANAAPDAASSAESGTTTPPPATTNTPGQTLHLMARNHAALRARPLRTASNGARKQSKSGAAKGKGRAGPTSGDDAAIDSAEQTFRDRIGDRARNKNEFHNMMKGIYGERYDESTVESLRMRALKGDTSFLPKARFVSSESLGGNHAAYDASSGTILLNENLKNNPSMLADYYAEEAGHHIDTFFGKGDAVGDEGELMRNALNGTTLTEIEIAAIRAEDDRGTITVDGREIEVEFGFFKKIKKGFKKIKKGVKKGFKKIKNGIKKIGKKIWKGIKSVGMWLMTSTIGQYVMTAALAAFSVVTAGAGTMAMVAWEAAKQAALAVGRSIIVKKAASFVGKITGSKTLGRIAGAIGSAFAGGKINMGSTAALASSAGKVAKNIAVSEAKRAVKQKVLSKIKSPFLQKIAGWATDAGIDAVGNFAYAKITETGEKKDVDGASDKTKAGDENAVAKEPSPAWYDLRGQARVGLDKLGKMDLSEVTEKLAPKELASVINTITNGDLANFTLNDLYGAVKAGLNDFKDMSAQDVAQALQYYVENAVESMGDVDASDISDFAAKAFEQIGELKVDDLVGLAGINDVDRKSLVKIAKNLGGGETSTVTVGMLLGMANAKPADDVDERAVANG